MSYSMKDWLAGNARPNALHAPQATINNPPRAKGWPLEGKGHVKIQILLDISSPEMRSLLLLDMCKSRVSDYRLLAACHEETPMSGVVLYLQDDLDEGVRYAAVTRVAAQLFSKKGGNGDEV